MASAREVEAMDRAVLLARRGIGGTSPNPVVGCVVLDPDGTVVGEGWHAEAGGPHAEVNALLAAGLRAHGGTAVVTLEPCAHQGRTGPCTEALIEAGIARVVYAVADPSAVAGGGADALRSAGIDVEAGTGAPLAEAVNREWLTAVRLQRPFVTVKFASSLDGRVAAADGTSRWITGPEARADVHRLRAECDAVLVGTGTVIQDNPRLTVRDAALELRDRSPLRVVVGERAIPPESALLTDGRPTLVLESHDLDEVLAVLHGRGVRSVLVEAGPTLTSAFLAAGLVDRVVAYLAPMLLGEGRSAVSGIGVTTIGETLRLNEVEVAVLGDDVRIIGVPQQQREDAA